MTIDFITYFNSFSLKKWKEYTTLHTLYIKVAVKGTFLVKLIGYKDTACEVIKEYTAENRESVITVPLSDLDHYDIAGCILEAQEDGAVLQSMSYYGDFTEYHEESLGIVICTFNRQEYVTATVNNLTDLVRSQNWLSVTVIDNGRNLALETEYPVKVIPNKNFGGAGGFTRGLIEVSQNSSATYALLMDDDIDFDPTVIVRTRSLLCGLKSAYRESFLAGSMLEQDNPVIQYENKAYWDRYHLVSMGKQIDVSHITGLIKNEETVKKSNMYAAWWYCAIPVRRISDIGLPLPVFIKGDDMEYGIRNNRDIISMNGIGVWHESFASKVSPVINYFSDRNMLIINNYAAGCNFFTFLIALFGRLIKRLLRGDGKGIIMFKKALDDYNSGLEGITSVGADEKFTEIRQYAETAPKRAYITVWGSLFTSIVHYSSIRKAYIKFRDHKLRDDSFWRKFLAIEVSHDK